MTIRPRRRPSVPISVLLGLAALTWPAVVAAHAELTASDPANGASITGPLADPVVLQFSEALQSGSHAELLDPGGTKVADATIDASNRARMLFTPAAPLQPGRYTVQWTSVAADKDVARGQLVFTVVAPTTAPVTPTPLPLPATQAPTAAASAPPTAAPTPTAAVSSAPPVASASPTPAGSGAAGVADAIVPVVAALALVAVVANVLLRRGRGAA